MRKAYTFDDICLVPCYNDVASRLDPSVSTWFTKNMKIDIPIINSPMDTVISFELADILLEMGGMPIFNRRISPDKYQEIYDRYGNVVTVSTCVNSVDEIQEIIDMGFDKILLDTAYGYTKRMSDTVNSVKSKNPSVTIIAGNVCTAQGTMELIQCGVDAIRVGIGGGAACTTRMITAVGVPQFTAVQECAEEAKRFRVPIICDGGIRNSRDICLALAAGATTVMVGKLFALTEESAARKRGVLKEREANYRGQASADFQKDHYGGVKEGTVAEGVGFWAPVSGSANELLEELIAGLRSSMTYLGAETIKEYQDKASFMEVSPTYMAESKPRRK